jgi:NhaP-type Na+/H+ or K+/H+ antiporter
MPLGVATAVAVIVLYAATALWLGRRSISMPTVLVAAGYVLGSDGLDILPFAHNIEQLKGLTEITLALLLFADASTLNVTHVRHDPGLPLRLLTVGLLLTIALGTVATLGLFPDEGVAFACLLGALLAPTDAALGLPIFTNPQIPVRIRRALNIESGLNDGIATPFVGLFLAFAIANVEHGAGAWIATAVGEIVVAVVIGTLIGVVGAWLMQHTTSRGWTSGGSEQIAILGLAFAAYFSSLAAHGNGFVAAFVGGIVFGSASRNRFSEPTEFTETFSTFLSMLVWGVFGAFLLPRALGFTSDWRPVVYALVSLTLVRMLPVALALVKTHLRADTILLMGWFGPRGLASVVFTLLTFVTFHESGRQVDTLVALAGWTIVLSVVLHGLTASPLAAWYAQRLGAAGGEPAELIEVPEMRPRHRVLVGAPRRADRVQDRAPVAADPGAAGQSPSSHRR